MSKNATPPQSNAAGLNDFRAIRAFGGFSSHAFFQ